MNVPSAERAATYSRKEDQDIVPAKVTPADEGAEACETEDIAETYGEHKSQPVNMTDMMRYARVWIRLRRIRHDGSRIPPQGHGATIMVFKYSRA